MARQLLFVNLKFGSIQPRIDGPLLIPWYLFLWLDSKGPSFYVRDFKSFSSSLGNTWLDISHDGHRSKINRMRCNVQGRDPSDFDPFHPIDHIQRSENEPTISRGDIGS